MLNVKYLDSDCWMPFVASCGSYKGLLKQLCWFMTKLSKLFIDPGLRTDDQIFTICLGLAKDELKAPGLSDHQWRAEAASRAMGSGENTFFLTFHIMLFFLGNGLDIFFINQGLVRMTKSPSLKMTLTMMTGPRGQTRKMTRTRSRLKRRRTERKSQPFLAESLARIRRLRHPNYLRGRLLAKGSCSSRT